MNGWTPAQHDVYHLSYAASATKKALLSRHQVPISTMWFYLQPFALAIGDGGEDEKWWQSDGVVNTVSENGPKLNSTDHIVLYEEGKPLSKGAWSFMETVGGFDHLELIGNGVQDALPIYERIAALLRGL